MVAIALIIVNFLVSIVGFQRTDIFEKYKFDLQKIQESKEYYRLATAGFLHVNWMHLIFNMISLWYFTGAILSIGKFGEWLFIIVYVFSLFSGSLLSLFIHRNKSQYTAVGASGAVAGVVFASTIIDPLQKIYMIPAGFAAIAYIIYTIYGIRKQADNIGHEAHLGGALGGFLITCLIIPSQTVVQHPIVSVLIVVPAAAFLGLLIMKPHVLLTREIWQRRSAGLQTMDDLYNERKIKEQKNIDAILDKISERGMKSLSKSEKEALEEYSKKQNR